MSDYQFLALNLSFLIVVVRFSCSGPLPLCYPYFSTFDLLSRSLTNSSIFAA